MNNSYINKHVGTPSMQDLKSGFLVFLIALPLCLGISVASGFPPVAGILTAIVGGLLVSFIGGAKLTIKGPAAGLIVIAIGSVMELGQGDMMLGYERTLAVGVVAAAIQIVFSFFKAATIGIIMSPSVVHGMLAAIGVIIIAKQSHIMLGATPEAKAPLDLLAEIPNSIINGNPEIMLLGVLALIILVVLPKLRVQWLNAIPAPIVVLLITIPISLMFNFNEAHNYIFMGKEYLVGPQNLVQLPGSLMNAIAFPDFSVVFSGASIKYIIMFALIGTIESTLSALAVDSMDPEKETSNLNKDLFATGCGNLLCSFIGGLPMISEIVRSKANIDSGAQSRWSNFYHGLFLLLFVAIAPALLSQIPLAVLAAMLVFTGARLASISQLFHARKIGVDQLILFSTTLVMTLVTDLLVGVATGLVLKFILHTLRGAPLSSMFYPKLNHKIIGSQLEVSVQGAATFSSLLPLRKLIARYSDEVSTVSINLSQATLVDHTFLNRVATLEQEWPHLKITTLGSDQLKALTEHPEATRMRVFP